MRLLKDRTNKIDTYEKFLKSTDINDDLIYNAIMESNGKIPNDLITKHTISPHLQNRINKLCFDYVDDLSNNEFQHFKTSCCYQTLKKFHPKKYYE